MKRSILAVAVLMASAAFAGCDSANDNAATPPAASGGAGTMDGGGSTMGGSGTTGGSSGSPSM